MLIRPRSRSDVNACSNALEKECKPNAIEQRMLAATDDSRLHPAPSSSCFVSVDGTWCIADIKLDVQAIEDLDILRRQERLNVLRDVWTGWQRETALTFQVWQARRHHRRHDSVLQDYRTTAPVSRLKTPKSAHTNADDRELLGKALAAGVEVLECGENWYMWRNPSDANMPHCVKCVDDLIKLEWEMLDREVGPLAWSRVIVNAS